MMGRNSYIGLREAELNLMMTEACGATNCTMMDVGRATSSTMNVRGATKVIRGIYKVIFIFMVIDMRYFTMR